METKSFSTIRLRLLKVADLYSLSKSTINYALPVKDSMGELLKATFTQLETETGLVATALNKTRKSGLTLLIESKRKGRKDHFSEIKRNVQTASRSLDTRTNTAGAALKIFFEPYWHIDDRAMNTATAVFEQMIARYKADEDLLSRAATIGISEMLTALETLNNEFDVLYKARNNEKAALEGPNCQQLKAGFNCCLRTFLRCSD